MSFFPETNAGKAYRSAFAKMDELIAEQRMTNRLLYRMMTPTQRHTFDAEVRADLEEQLRKNL